MKNQKPLFLLVAFLLLFSQPFSLAEENPNPVRADLISEVKSIHPGKSFWVGIHFKMEPGWHTYWKNPGEVGLPNKVSWDLPQGFSAGELQWPFPKKIMEADIAAFAYENEVLLLSEIKLPSTFNESAVVLKAKVGWLACKEICLPGEANVALELPIKTDAFELDERFKNLFSDTRLHLPVPAPDWNLKVQKRWGKFVLGFSNPTIIVDSAEFFSLSKRVVNLSAPQELKKTKTGYELILVPSKELDKSTKQFQGVLVFKGSWKGLPTERALWVNLTI